VQEGRSQYHEHLPVAQDLSWRTRILSEKYVFRCWSHNN